MTPADKRALEQLERYLAIGSDANEDYMVRLAHKLGAATAMLAHLLGILERSYPETQREMFTKWLAQQPTESQP